jgi:hypothetical protein
MPSRAFIYMKIVSWSRSGSRAFKLPLNRLLKLGHLLLLYDNINGIRRCRDFK